MFSRRDGGAEHFETTDEIQMNKKSNKEPSLRTVIRNKVQSKDTNEALYESKLKELQDALRNATATTEQLKHENDQLIMKLSLQESTINQLNQYNIQLLTELDEATLELQATKRDLVAVESGFRDSLVMLTQAKERLERARQDRMDDEALIYRTHEVEGTATDADRNVCSSLSSSELYQHQLERSHDVHLHIIHNLR